MEQGSSVWIGYGCRTDEVFWSESFGAWWASYHVAAPMIGDLPVLMVVLATTSHYHADSPYTIELPYDTVFPLEQVTDVIPEWLIHKAMQSWERLREEASTVGFLLPTGQLLFVHLA